MKMLGHEPSFLPPLIDINPYQDTHAWINLYYVSVDKNSHAFLTQEAATKVKLRQNGGGWVEISVMDIAGLWFKNPDMNLGLVIHVNTSTGEELKIGFKHQPNAVR